MILVTGGAGFIGSALVKRLVSAGEEVMAFDNCSRGSFSRLPTGALHVVGNIQNRHDLMTAFGPAITEVIHLACINGTENFYTKPDEVLHVGVVGMLNVMFACYHYKVDKLMFASSSEVYQTPTVVPTPETVPCVIPDPYNPRYSYAACKMISEMFLIHNKDGPRHATIVRPHNIYGPDMGYEHVIPQLALKIKKGEDLYFQGNEPQAAVNGQKVFYGGEQTRAFTYIDDAIDQIMLVREHGKHLQTYNIGNEEEVSIIDLAQRIAKRAGQTIKYTVGKPGDGGTLRRCPDMSKLKAMGYTPKVSLDEGLDKTLEWYWRK